MDIHHLLQINAPTQDLVAEIRRSPSTSVMLEVLRRAAPDLKDIPQTTYTLFREFEQSGVRRNYERTHSMKRTMLTRAVVEMILGDDSRRDVIHDLLWSICEETSWLFPAHEEQGPDFWDLKPSPRQRPWGAHTMLTREPDSIDLFAAETGATLAEAVYLLGDRLAPEVVQRVRQQVERHIFRPYLAYGRKHWWHKGALNWNGVCNGSIGLAFIRLEQDAQTLAEAIEQVLEGFEAYVATGFEADGGSIEGISYWNYGLMYYVTLAELLRERTNGQLDLLAAPRMKDIARYPLVTALSSGTYVNFGDATEELALSPGTVQRLAERTGVEDLRALLIDPMQMEGRGVATAKLAIMLRDIAWWDGQRRPFPAAAHQDFYLPQCAVIKHVGQSISGKPVILTAKAGHNDGHHSHTDIGHFILHVDGESLLCDPGRGLYSRDYFRQQRYDNIFCNSISHNVPRIGGHVQAPGPEWNGHQQFHGVIIAHSEHDDEKSVVIDFHQAYDLPALTCARRTLRLMPKTGEALLEDVFAFDGSPLEIEEAFLTWFPVEVGGSITSGTSTSDSSASESSSSTARIVGQRSTLELAVQEPAGAIFQATSFEEECRANKREGVLTRLTLNLPSGTLRFRLRITVAI